MAHEVESMFYVREVPWHGLGVQVQEAPRSVDALKLAGLDWKVNQEPIYTADMFKIDGFKANIRSTDKKVLGVVTDRYSVVQNDEAFQFTDSLLGEGVRYETAGSLAGGKRVWLLAKLPDTHTILGDEVMPYLVFSNSYDGSAAIRVAITPIRVVCQNTLNLAMANAKRMWSAPHVGRIEEKFEEAKQTLLHANHYMTQLNKEAENLIRKYLTDKRAKEFIQELIEMPDNATVVQARNTNRLRDDLAIRYFEAPDLEDMPKSAWRIISAISDFATHTEPLRKTVNYKENLFAKTVGGNALIDKAYEMLKAI
ncbi:MAG: DUF932 domain-containing protein [Lutispora sp.]|nr:DUF932 domain-containing protein [Lutispora sp.]